MIRDHCRLLFFIGVMKAKKNNTKTMALCHCLRVWEEWKQGGEDDDDLCDHCRLMFFIGMTSVATLALGLWPRQGLAKVRAKNEAQESHFMLSRVWESVKEWTPTLPSEFSLWELDFQIFKIRLQESKPIGLKNSLYHWKFLRT